MRDHRKPNKNCVWRFIVIKIEVRKDGVYSMGYPYNAPVDNYFKSLTEDFIKNYGLSQSVINEINRHKNDTQKFDLDVHQFVLKLSAFMIEFDTVGQKMINEYQALKDQSHALQHSMDDLNAKKVSATEELAFVTTNVERLKSDIVKIVEIINHYRGKVVDSTEVYSDTYISEAQATLTILSGLITQTNTSFDFYLNSIRALAQNLATSKHEMEPRTFPATSLRSMFEEWQKRPEEYFRKLVTYYQDEYDSHWTYGSSLVYGEKSELEEVTFAQYNDIADKLQEELFKKYSFKLDQSLKQFALVWLNNNTSFDPERFKYTIENKKIELLVVDITEVETLLKQKTQNINNILIPSKFANYNKYKEFVMEKRKYVISNINGVINPDVLRDLDIKISELEPDYLFIHNRLTRNTYWEALAEKDMYSELLTELNRKLQKAKTAVSSGFTVVDVDNSATLEKIEFYSKEKAVLDKKVSELITIKDKLEVDLNAYNDELSLIDSRIYENKESIVQKIAEYTVFFDSRVPFFTQNVTGKETDAIIGLLNGDFFRGFDDFYTGFVNYSHPTKWYSEDDRSKLKKLYKKILEIITDGISREWEREFSHDILNDKKHGIYGEYLSREIKTLFATINKHILDARYVTDFVMNIKPRVDKIKNIFKVYSYIGYSLKKNILVNTDMFDYQEMLEFDFAGGEETEHSVNETFFQILDDIVTFAHNKNLEFKDFDMVVDNQKKIDSVWLDMEKKYV